MDYFAFATAVLFCVCKSCAETDGQDFITLSTQSEYTVHLGENVSLVCGFNLTRSDATIVWRPPDGTRIKLDDPKDYIVKNGPEIVRLDIIGTDLMDDGLWNCTLEEAQYIVPLIEIHLNVVSPLSEPLNLTVESVSYSWVAIQWQEPNDVGSHTIILHYNVSVYRIVLQNSTEVLINETSTRGNETHANITGLQPGMSFQIQVAGVVRLRNLNIIGLGQSSDPILVNTSIAAPMPICNSEPHLITGSMNSNNITFAVAWNYSHNTEGLHLSRVVLNYSIPMRGYLGQIRSTRITISENLRINQTSKMITVSSMNVNSGAFVINITVSNSQGSTTTMCPSLHLEVNIIQLVLKGVHNCQIWVLSDTIEKQQAILSHFQGYVQNRCDRCEYMITNLAMECAQENSEVVVLRAKLFSPLNMTKRVFDSIREWIQIHSVTGSIVVRGLRVYPERDCALIIEEFGSPLNCDHASATTISTSSASKQPITPTVTVSADHPREQHRSAVTEALAIIGFVGCGILIVIVLLLALYVGYQRYKRNCQKAQRLSRNADHQQDELQIPMVNINRLSTTSHISIPETIPECEFEGSEISKDDFDLSTSLAYGAVDSVTASRLRLGSDLGSISENLERTYHNPIYESNPIYETIKVERTRIDLRPNSPIDCESSDHT